MALLLFRALLLLPVARGATITFGAIITDANTTLDGQHEARAAQLAVDAVNADGTLLPGHTAVLSVIDDGGSKWTAMRAACELMRERAFALSRGKKDHVPPTSRQSS